MKAYGLHRRDQQSCKYGCCVTKYNKKKNGREESDRSRRKTARQISPRLFSSLIEDV